MSGKIIVAGSVAVIMFGIALLGYQPVQVDRAKTRAAAMARATDPSLETVLQRQRDGHFYVDALVNDKLVHFLVDTGASGIALTQDDARTVGIAVDPAKFEIVGQGASGDVQGQFVNVHHIAIGQKEAWDLPSVVLADGMDVSLLGQSYLSQIGSVAIVGDKMTLR